MTSEFGVFNSPSVIHQLLFCFNRYKHFLQVQITSDDEEDFGRWVTWVESRIRILFMRLILYSSYMLYYGEGLIFIVLDRLESVPLFRIHPFARFFNFKEMDGTYTSWIFIGLDFQKSNDPLQSAKESELTIDLSETVRTFANYVDQWEERTNSMDLAVKHVVRSQIPAWVIDAAGCNLVTDKGLMRREKMDQCRHSAATHAPVRGETFSSSNSCDIDIEKVC